MSAQRKHRNAYLAECVLCLACLALYGRSAELRYLLCAGLALVLLGLEAG